MPLLGADRFRPVASGGLGHPGSTMAHSMAWFRGALYLGTSTPSTRSPENRARIWRLEGGEGEWELAYDSPLLPLEGEARQRATWLGSGGGGGIRRSEADAPATMGREFGLRSMAVFQGRSDPAPCLYVGTMSLWGGRILRSEDGRRFEPVIEPGLGDDRIMSFRGLTVLGDRLLASPTGTIEATRIDRNLAPSAVVHASDDPASGRFERVCEPGFGDPLNVGVFSLTVAQGHAYAGTGSPRRGFQLWRSPLAGEAPFAWERVLTDGAGRFNLNLSTVAKAEFRGDLYVGTGLPGFGYDKDNDVGPGAAELIRLRPDGSWDLIFGEARFTPDGLKVPLSGRGPGLDDPYNSAVWSMGVHDGALYLGTHQWEPNDVAANGGGAPIRGGWQLWGSEDGETWEKVLDEGHGNPTSTGLRTILSTPAGLFIGTSNHARLIQAQLRLRGGGGGALPDGASEGFEVFRAA